MVPLPELHRGGELAGRLVEVTAQQADPAQHRQPEGLAPWVAGLAGQAAGLLEEEYGPRVVGAVAGDRPR